MDTALLTSEEFWADQTPAIASLTALAGHVLFETSGSSGKPKQVAISKQALLVSAAAVNQHLLVTHASRWGLALPLNHVGGFGVVARTWQAGCDLAHFCDPWNALTFRDWAHSEKITHTSLVPTQVHDLVAAGLSAPTSLVAVVVGGGHLDIKTGQAARELGWPILASYGMTEAGSQIATQSLDALGAPYISSPIPLLPFWQARVAENGLLSISGPALFSGYVVDGNFYPRECDWHTTSDLAELGEGLLTPTGRADSLVKILGELVNPEEIERELISIADGGLLTGSFAIIAIPDARTENSLRCIVDSSVDGELIEKTLSAYNQTALGFRRLPTAIQLDRFPRSALGKIKRSELAVILLSSFGRIV